MLPAGTFDGKVVMVTGGGTGLGKGMAIEFDDKDNRDIRLLLSTIRKLDQAPLLALSRSALGE